MTALLPDAAARAVILTDLDDNLVVEAAAGTGKTTCLVGRLLNLMKSGALSKSARFAAVTFTTKAAAELRQRLDLELARRLDAPDTPPRERQNLSQARQNLAECHIGTIHSFCARLLRERPVEAGVAPDFREMDDNQDLLLRARAWNAFSRHLTGGDHPDLYAAFELFGLDLDTLGQGFSRFAEYPDITSWPGADATIGQIDLNAFTDGVTRYAATLADLEPRLDSAEPGTDKLIPILQNLARRRRRHLPDDLGQAFQFARMLRPLDAIVQTAWRTGLDCDKNTALERLDAYRAFHDATVKPFLTRCLAAVYAASIQAFHAARDIYDRLRRDEEALNFQDLLMTTAAVLRDFPDVRRDLSERYSRLLVDEVQDTDPIQAEIMFLLAADNPSERDWRRCTPRPGSLFIVGDPKQSIYRFRRADIVVYQDIKRRILESGGKQAGLTANFRSQPDILDWVNATFFIGDDTNTDSDMAVAPGGRFTAHDSPYSPAYIPLRAGLNQAPASAWHGVFYLETIPVSKKNNTTERDVARDEAARIAAFIRNAIDTGLEIPDRSGARSIRPADFLIVTYRKSATGVYADALRRLGVECLVSGGQSLGNSPVLSLLLGYLDALNNPDDGIRLLGVLRGALHGISDRDLFAWKEAGNAFSFLGPYGADTENTESPLARALTMMRAHHALFASLHPCHALDQVVLDLGLWGYSALGDHPGITSGILGTAIDLLKAAAGDLPTLGHLHDHLEWLMENHESDPISAVRPDNNAVRVMNVHKTKGLEAPVVFLTGTRGVKAHDADFAIHRDGGDVRGALSMRGGEFGNLLLAQPAEWEVFAAGEELFLAAERTRLNYVAATRAGAALIVSVHKTGKEWKSAFLPEFQPGVTIADKLPEPGQLHITLPETPSVLDGDSLTASHRKRESTRPRLLAESYAVSRAKPDFVPAGFPAFGETDETGMEYGSILHRLLEIDLPKPRPARIARIHGVLREYGYANDHAEEFLALVDTVQQSAIWQRAAASPQAFREFPFTLSSDVPGGAALQRGVIDLVFREDDGWVIVDYKSNSVQLTDLHAASAQYRPQIEAYARAWSALTGEGVIERGIYFIRPDAYVVIDEMP